MPSFLEDYSGKDEVADYLLPTSNRICMQVVGEVDDPVTGLPRQFFNSCQREDILNQVVRYTPGIPTATPQTAIEKENQDLVSKVGVSLFFLLL